MKPIEAIVRMPPSPWYSSAIFLVFFGWFLGMVSAILVESVRRRLFRPVLTTEHTKRAGFVVLTTLKGVTVEKYDAKYLRVRVRNLARTTAKGCRAYLTEIERWEGDEFVKADFYRDTLRLRWAYEGEEGDLHEGIDIPKGVLIHFDVLSTRRAATAAGASEDDRFIQVANHALRYDRDRLMNKLEYEQKYRFRILVVADDADPQSIDLVVVMGRTWKDFEVIEFNGKPVQP